MESELELHDEIQKMHIISTVPEYYPVLNKLHATDTILGLLNHDNSGSLMFNVHSVGCHCRRSKRRG